MGIRENLRRMDRQSNDEDFKEYVGRQKARGFRLEDRQKAFTARKRLKLGEVVTLLAIGFIAAIAVSFMAKYVILAEELDFVKEEYQSLQELASQPEVVEAIVASQLDSACEDLESLKQTGPDGDLPGVVVYDKAGNPQCRAPTWAEAQMIAQGHNLTRC